MVEPKLADFVDRQNIAHFTRRLIGEPDPIKREILQRLLTEEMVKQASYAPPPHA